MLHEAAMQGDLDVCKLLIENGANVNATDEWGGTPLHSAIAYGHLDVCKHLIKHGANVNVINRACDTPLYYPAAFNKMDACKLLIEHGAKITPSILRAAAKYGHIEILKYLSEVRDVT